MNYTPTPKGFIEPVISPDDYFFGAGQIETEELQPDGQWLAPEGEAQKKAFETFNCTSFTITTCVEILLKKKFNIDDNFSDRFLGTQAGTDRNGNSPNKVAEILRKQGLVLELMMPFSDDLQNIDEYYSYKNVNERKRKGEGLNFLDDYLFRYDWVLVKNSLGDIRKELMMRALRFSPLGVSVYAWLQDGERYVNPSGIPPIHFTTCKGYKEGEYWIILDSYKPYIKHLAWDFPFNFVQRYDVKIAPLRTNWVVDLFKRLFGL